MHTKHTFLEYINYMYVCVCVYTCEETENGKEGECYNKAN